MTKVITTIQINNEASNPIAVEAAITGYHEYPGGWEWEIDEIKRVELVMGDKEGIDITRQVLSNKRALAILISQVGEEADQIADALNESEDENIQIDEIIERRLGL